MQICNCVRKLSLLFKFRSKIWRITGETESISVDQFDRFFAANATEHISGRHPSFGAPLAPTRISVVDDGDVGEMYRFQPSDASPSRSVRNILRRRRGGRPPVLEVYEKTGRGRAPALAARVPIPRRLSAAASTSQASLGRCL